MTARAKDSEVPDRIGWALGLLSSRQPKLLLEIGPGSGAACRPFLQRHRKADYVGLDRSSVAEERFEARNADLIELGRASFVRADFLDPSTAVDADLALAINVNAFWTSPEEAFPAARRLLSRPAALLLVYEAPGASRCAEIAEVLSEFRHPELMPDGIAIRPQPRMIAQWFSC